MAIKLISYKKKNIFRIIMLENSSLPGIELDIVEVHFHVQH